MGYDCCCLTKCEMSFLCNIHFIFLACAASVSQLSKFFLDSEIFPFRKLEKKIEEEVQSVPLKVSGKIFITVIAQCNSNLL